MIQLNLLCFIFSLAKEICLLDAVEAKQSRDYAIDSLKEELGEVREV
jgi:hypothetical protein